MEFVDHTYQQSAKDPKSIFCTACQRPKTHPIHRGKSKSVQGTVRPTKVG